MKGQLSIIVLVVLAVSMIFVAAIYFTPAGSTDELKRFASYQQLENFVKANVGSSYGYGTFGSATAMTTQTVRESTGADVSEAVPAASEAAKDYSETNIQVAGVDEADIVKNDGKYVYVVSGAKVVIVNAYPAEQANIISEIELNGTAQEIFINNDKLVIFGWEDYYSSGISIPEIGIAPRSYSQLTFIKVYDISDRSNPVLKRNIVTEGNYYDSRMIGDYAYVVVSQPVYYGGSDPIPLPAIESDGVTKNIAASEIYYFDFPDYSYTFTNIISVNTQNDNEDFKSKTYLMGYTQNMYVSSSNIYVVYTKRLREIDYFDRLIDEAIIPNVPFEIQLKINEIRNSDKEDYENSKKNTHDSSGRFNYGEPRSDI